MKLESLNSQEFTKIPVQGLKTITGGQATAGGQMVTYEGNSVQSSQDYFCDDDGDGLGYYEFAVKDGDNIVWVLRDGTVVAHGH